MSRLIITILALVTCSIAPCTAQISLEGAWDTTVTFADGTAAGVMRLELEGSAISGTSEPLDENQFFPLSVSGEFAGEQATLSFSFRDEVVGQVSATYTNDEFRGAGKLYGVSVELSAVRSDRPFRAPTVHEFRPTRYELQYESRREPVLSLVPGDRIKTSLLDNEGQDASLNWQAMPGNTLTGPFFVESAMPGDTLVVRLHSVRINRDTAKMHSRILNQAAVKPGHQQEPTEGWGRTWHLEHFEVI